MNDDSREDALSATLSVVSRKWTPQVVVALHGEGPLGFSELQSAIPGVSSKVLTQRLETLGAAGVVDRTVVSESPLRVEYTLTEAGRELEAVFDSLESWGQRHLVTDDPEVVVADEDRRLTGLFQRWFEPTYVVHRAHDRAELLEAVDDETTVVVYDTHLPGTGHADVPSLVGSVTKACRLVALLTGRIDLELLELDCDAVVRKPATKDTVDEVIETQVERYGEPPGEREYHALREKREALSSTVSAAVLAESERYEGLCERLEVLADDRESAGDDS
ncbi:HoxA-like transcriptional regulator [Natronorubrum sp. JWXQ-INN-674]|uniref:HoxA-like transcriptional regulator n=1 Tax=Natronorubrum halalkaliphilum TaxID=2691917 RepID=A0A6B0VLB4_9EURY|nr:winged helix-turn-helix transcriptional regulator [Natronorubrum halalkaliphilum]MXV61907.1 HoxA-like transcriptional regulator [Natronorubrum halalkaliphilum]